MRLNRIAAMENNVLNISLLENTSNAAHDDATETIAAQARAWVDRADSFEKLGRYEARISRQLLQYTKELERLRQARQLCDTEPAQPGQTPDNAPDNDKFGSFCSVSSDDRVTRIRTASITTRPVAPPVKIAEPANDSAENDSRDDFANAFELSPGHWPDNC